MGAEADGASPEEAEPAQAPDLRQLLVGLTAVRDGDFGRRLPQDGEGLLAEIATVFNGMVDQLSLFTSEVTRVAREVGTEGRLGGQAEVRGVSGTWRDLTDSVNAMAGNLTTQVRDIAQVATAVAKGDLSRKIDVAARGEILELKNTLNTMVDQLSSFAAEVTRVAREVGTEGRLGGQATVPGVGGTWRDLTDSVNAMAGNLTTQVRDIAQVATAVAKGDLSRKIDVAARGEILELKNTLNTMVDQLSSFAAEVTRVAREVGTEGRLGGQADVQGVSGTWKDLTESVNVMANNLTSQVRNIAQVTTAVAGGDLSQKIRVDARGEILELKETINTMVDQLSAFADEVTRVAREVGTEGNLGGQATVRGVSGTWKDLTDNVNVMASNLTGQVRSIAQVASAVARGDLSQKITVEAKGEVAALAGVINTMVDTLSAFADEVTRVAREVGTEGRLGGQARVPNVAGTWKDLTDNVNSMANNLTGQVRNIAQVTTAVAKGDLTRKIDVDARGEILELKTTINTMVDQLSSFAAEVTRVAREVGSEGRLGGQAEVEGVSGTWKRLTENVNELAGNLTRQVRAIAEVTSAVAEGDLTRSITVEASGEVAELKDNINSMVKSLRESTRANRDQDWLKSNLAAVTALTQGRRDLAEVADLIMDQLTPLVSAQYGAFFLAEDGHEGIELRQIAAYGDPADPRAPRSFRLGQALVGQAARSRTAITVDDVPPGYVRVASGLGEADPTSLVVLPIVTEDQVLGVIELASVRRFTAVQSSFLGQLTETIGVGLNAILANARTDELLGESQRLTAELQARQEELQRSNRELEERSKQLALASKYKSEFLANMSHELRTPLNSLLILAQLLAQNAARNLTPKQVGYAEVIHSAGSDLLQLINDILDLSKVEAGKMVLEPETVSLHELLEDLEATFRPLTGQKGLRFTVSAATDVPALIVTDGGRLQQVLRNLLSNAVKFTAAGGVELTVELADPADVPASVGSGPVLALRVEDTGIGILESQLENIFGAFQQADGTTSRKYGGTGLGLSISREIAHLLAGAITVRSTVGVGSVFTLYLPARPPVRAAADRLRPSATAFRRLLVIEGAADGPLARIARSAAAALPDADTEPVLVERAADAHEAAALAAAGPVRCVLLPLDASGEDVLGLLDQLAEEPALAETPILAYQAAGLDPSARPSQLTHARGHSLELVGSLDELRRCIAEHLAAEPAGQVSPAITQAVQARAAVPPDDGRLAGHTVLVVDDDPRNVFALTSMLEFYGMRVLHAVNGREGVQTLSEHPEIGLILMDVMMPELDGYEATSLIRADIAHADLPIIAVTAKAMQGDREKSLAAGASDYVTKPVNAKVLLERIRHHLLH